MVPRTDLVAKARWAFRSAPEAHRSTLDSTGFAKVSRGLQAAMELKQNDEPRDASPAANQRKLHGSPGPPGGAWPLPARRGALRSNYASALCDRRERVSDRAAGGWAAG